MLNATMVFTLTSLAQDKEQRTKKMEHQLQELHKHVSHFRSEHGLPAIP